MRIERLEIDDLRSIKRLRWPEDGIGWGGRIPDVVVVAGANGSGKTTLLNEIFDFIQEITTFRIPLQYLDIETLKLEKLEILKNNIISINNKKLTKENNIYEFQTSLQEHQGKIIHFKSNRSDINISNERPKELKQLNNPISATYVWSNSNSNDISIEQICYSARWEDANNFLNGRPDKATKFKFYADEFERFTEGDKKLVWSDEGELLVETRDGVRHDPNELSSGEHQALIFAMMLSRWWAPGSIVLIDEPELHMHTHWQAKLLQRIIDLQRERGGQAILATQSSDIYRMAPRGSKVQLGLWGSDD